MGHQKVGNMFLFSFFDDILIKNGIEARATFRNASDHKL